MTHCASENLYPADGLGWAAPDPLPLRFETDRLLIRSFIADDAIQLQRKVDESRDHLSPWLPWCKTGHLDVESTLHEIMTWIMEFRKPDSFSRAVLGVFLKDTQELIGGTGIHDVRKATASCETGYWISKDHTRNGYTEEACRATISWALRDQSAGGMGLNRVRIYTNDRNIPSTKLIEKLGIQSEVCQREDFYVDGYGLTTRLGWGVLAREWDCKNHCAIHAQG